jgi:hypothetical protein
VLPVVVFVFKRSPEVLGLLPYGAKAPIGTIGQTETSWSRKARWRPGIRFAIDRVRLSPMVQIGFF